MADAEKKEVVRDFSKVILTLENVLIPDEKLSPTPSMEDGLDFEVETDLRILGCELIQTSGILLKMPQVAMACGQVLFQRFYYSKSFVKHNMETVAMACINVASKIEECPRRIRDVINVFHHIKQVRNGKNITPLVLDQNYINLKNQVIKSERRILKELGFCVHVKHPHKIIVMYLQVLESQNNQRLAQASWNYMNDSFRTNVFMRFNPETIACACIYLAARKLQIPLPVSPPWYALFGVNESECQDISRSILELYIRQKPNIDQIEKAVSDCKKVHIEAKLKARALTGNCTPNSTSRPATPNKVSPSPLNSQAVKKLKDGDNSDHSSFGSRLDNHNSRKKRSHSRTRSGSSRSRSRSRSKSRSYSSHGSASPPSPRRSLSPVHKKESRSEKKYYSSSKDYYDRDYHRDRDRDHGREVREHKHKRRRHSPTYSPTRSYSISPEPRPTKNHKKSYYKDKERYRSRSRSREHDRHRSSKKRNGHHRNSSRDHYRR